MAFGGLNKKLNGTNGIKRKIVVQRINFDNMVVNKSINSK